jgi:hypothetical protein
MARFARNKLSACGGADAPLHLNRAKRKQLWDRARSSGGGLRTHCEHGEHQNSRRTLHLGSLIAQAEPFVAAIERVEPLIADIRKTGARIPRGG